MADLSTKTLKQAQPGLLHTDSTTDVSALSSNWAVVEDGDGNRSGLWLKSSRHVSIGDDNHKGGTSNYPLYITSLTGQNDFICIEDQNDNKYEMKTNPVGTIYHKWGGSTDIARNIYFQCDGGAGATSDGKIIFSVGAGGYLGGASSGTGVTITGTNDNNNKSTVSIGATNSAVIPSTGTDIPTALTVWGDMKVYGQIRTAEADNVFYVDVVNGDDADAGTSAKPIASINEVMTRVNGLSGQNITIYLLGKDDSSSGNASDNGYTIGVDCYLYNCNLKIKGLKYDKTEFDTSDGDHDLPRLNFSMNNTVTDRGSFGFWLNNCTADVSNLRLITPIWTTDEEKDDANTDAMFKTLEGRYSIRIQYCRTEIGDVPLIAGGESATVDITLFRNRIIRSDAGLSYGSVGQSGGQDNSGTAGVPVWNTDHFENVVTAHGTKGYFANTHMGRVWILGDTTTYTGGLAGFFGAFPSDDSGTYSYTNPTANDQQNGMQTLFKNPHSIYVATAGTTGKLPVNFQSNKVTSWYEY